ncbi:radical SAM protein [Candidatus Pelagibacter bacterium nBUS_30]|uniref:radical SAM protein n=1 Tax=Candidatus Pelagibacter bacterium nBUS_30 TaxID=3374191 RepID=UPI003EBE8B3F
MRSFNKKNYLKKFKLVKLYLLIKTKAYYSIENLKMVLRKIFKIQHIPDIFNNINIETSSVCNLGCKFCGYTKRDENKYPFKVMSDEDFYENVKQAEIYGFKNIGLSPVTGDIYMDKNLSNKFRILENSNIDGFYFVTNFIATKHNDIDEYFSLRKLKSIEISIYGHDLETFKKISDSNDVSYFRLIDNLKYIYEKLKNNVNNFTLGIDQRDSKTFKIENDNSDLSLIIKKILSLKKNNIKYNFETNYNNWGGMINNKDLEGLNLQLNDGKEVFKVGACSLLFSRLIIGADNTVNACACRDANYSLRIGNTKNSNLKEILSYKNKKYLNIIKNHENENYPDICKNCDFYTSIYSTTHKAGIAYDERKRINLKEFYKLIQ